MGLGHSPKIVTNGLMMCMDAANTKSYRNYNLATYSQDFTNAVWTKSTGLVSATGLLAPDDTLTASTLTDDDAANYENWSRSFTVPNDSASYNISIYIKKTTGGTSTRTGFNVSFTGGTTKNYNVRFNADTGVVVNGDTNLVTSENNGYWRLSFTVSNNSTGNTTLGISYYPATGVYNGGDVATATGSHTVWGVQVTRGTALLPYRTNVNDSSNIWYDLSNSSVSATLTSGTGVPIFTANNSGIFTFDGSTMYASTGLTLSGSTFRTHSLETVAKRSGTASETIVWGWQGYNCGILMQSNNINASNWYSNGSGGWLNATASSGISAQVDTWYHIVLTFNATGFMRIYVNGVNYASTDVSGFTTSSGNVWYLAPMTFAGFSFAGYRFPGSIALGKIYSTELSAKEVLQNFNCVRGRFGL